MIEEQVAQPPAELSPEQVEAIRHRDDLVAKNWRRRPRRQAHCNVPGCSRKHYGLGLCDAHHYRLKEWGDVRPDLPLKPQGAPVETRLFAKRRIVIETGCWEWTGKINVRHPYGTITLNGKPHRVHRVAMHLLRGFDLQSSKMICHRCDNKRCFNPDHLFVGTGVENAIDFFGKSFRRSNTKLTPEKIRLIRELVAHQAPIEAVALCFDITASHVKAILKKKAWRHVG